ncbi:MAG: hypothetical protein KIT79_15845 [Deltaproteobacteria bacterium]|nr:hypothetical protein [Deltaproteobacteria bacterium]
MIRRRAVLAVSVSLAAVAAIDLALRPALDRLCAKCAVPVQFSAQFDPQFIWNPTAHLPPEAVRALRSRLDTWRTPPDPGAAGFRVLVAGDTVGVGPGGRPELSFPSRLAARLSERFVTSGNGTGSGPAADIINFSVPGFSTFQVYRLVEKELPGLHLDLLIVAAGAMDAVPSGRSDASWVQYRLSGAGKWRQMAETSGLVRLGRRLLPPGRGPDHPVPRVSRIERELLIDRLLRITAPQNVLLAVLPTDFTSADSVAVAQHARSQGALAVEFMPELRRQEVDLAAVRSMDPDPEANRFHYAEYLLVHRTQTEIDDARRRIAEETGLPPPETNDTGLFETPVQPNRYGHEYLAMLWERRLAAILPEWRERRGDPLEPSGGFLPGGVPVMEVSGRDGALPDAPKGPGRVRR